MTQAAMNNGIVLYELKLEREAVEASLEVLTQMPKLISVLSSPIISEQEKEQLLNRIGSEMQMPEKLIIFLKVMCRHNMVEELPDIYTYYKQYWDEQHKVKRVCCIFASEPSEKQMQEIKNFLNARYEGYTLVYQTQIKPELLGGVILRVEHEEYDWSYEGRLAQMEQAIRA